MLSNKQCQVFKNSFIFKKKKPWAATCTYLVWVILHNKLMGPEKSWSGRPHIHFLMDFPEIFSFLCFFFFLAFLYYCLFFLLVCFLKLKIYILKHIRLCGRVSDKYFFTRSFFGNKTTFFGLVSKHIFVDSSIQQKINHILFVQKQLVL